MARDKINIGKELLEIGTAKAKLWGTVIAGIVGIVSAPSRRREMAEARRVGEQMKQNSSSWAHTTLRLIRVKKLNLKKAYRA